MCHVFGCGSAQLIFCSAWDTRLDGVFQVSVEPFVGIQFQPVVCVDEKPVVLHADVRPPRPMRPGRIARRDCEYERRGTD